MILVTRVYGTVNYVLGHRMSLWSALADGLDDLCGPLEPWTLSFSPREQSGHMA